MKKDISALKLISSFFVRILGIMLILFTILAGIIGIEMSISINEEGFIGMYLERTDNNANFLKVTSVREDYQPYISGIRDGDTVIKINGEEIPPDVEKAKLIGRKKIGSVISFTIRKNNLDKDYSFTFIPTPLFDKIVTVMFRIIPVFLMLSYVLVGCWGILKSPYSNITLLIALFCFSFGSFMYATITAGSDPEHFIRKYLYFDSFRKFISYFMFYASSFWLLLFAVFPYKHKIFIRSKTLSLIFIFLLPVLVTFNLLISINPVLFTTVILVLIFLNMGLGVMLLTHNSKRAVSVLEKRQLKLMLFGVKYGAISVGIGWIVVILLQFIFPGAETNFRLAGFIVFLLCEVAGLIIPFTFLNSFFQNKLLETESALRRKVRYLGVTIALLIVYFVILYLIGHFSLTTFEIQDRSIIIAVVLILSLSFAPLRRRFINWIDEKFYPERTIYTNSLKEYIRRISAYIDRNDLLRGLIDWIENTTGIKTVIPVTLDSYYEYDSPFNFREGNGIVNRFKRGEKFFWDEVSELSASQIRNKEIDWAKENEISLSLPMLSHGELVGVLNLGRKSNDEDYTMEDIDIITQASTQTALALQNMKLQSAFLEKRRLDKELEMARDIQKRLLPHQIPAVIGLDVHGASYPCFEVAGDYFDVINIENNNTVFVMADVSGKGAGAAMIMSNLQASVRVGIGISEEFKSFVSRINNHIYNHTSASEFITFFMGIWESQSGTLHYINAGHNPPLVIDSNNNVTRLEATGMILGIFENQEFEVGKITLEPDSVLFIYTDGLEEALNSKNELFGTDRIIGVLKTVKDKSPAEIINSMMESFNAYRDSEAVCDDITMIVAKRFV